MDDLAELEDKHLMTIELDNCRIWVPRNSCSFDKLDIIASSGTIELCNEKLLLFPKPLIFRNH